jgi:hypothetical protein
MSDDRLRTALRELGDVPPAPDLASAALRRLERDRRRTRIGLIVGVVVAVTAAVVVPTALRGRTQAAPPAAPTPVTGPGWVSAYFALDLANGRDGFWVYDAAARGYRPTAEGVGTVTPSPDGQQALVRSKAGFAVVPIARTERPLTSSDILPELAGNEWSWSPDGTKLLGYINRGQLTATSVFDVKRRTVSRVPLHLDHSVRNRELGWAPDGGFVVTTVPQASIRMQPQQRTEVDFLDRDGRITRRLFLAKVDHVAPSPDGTLALVSFFPTINNVIQPPNYQLLDLRTGERRPAPASRWAYGHHLFRLDPAIGEQIDPHTGLPTEPTSVIVVDGRTGATVHRTRLPVPDKVFVQDIRISLGAVPPGAIGL